MTARRKVTSASHFGKKSVVDGYKFDSQKELDFYLRYIKNSGYEFEVQARTNIDYEYSELIGDEN